MKKRYYSFVLTMLMSMFALCASAHDIEVKNADDGVTIYYNYINNNTNNNTELEVTYRGSYYDSYSDEYTGNVVIPKSITYNGKTYDVTAIGERAFYGCSGLTSVTIPNSVTSIGEWAFYDCSGLTSITIPNSVTSIGSVTFEGCSGLTSIDIPNSVTSIGGSAFYGCSGLTSVTIGNSVTSIEFGVFYGCSGLTSVTIPNSVTRIGQCAFYGCSKLTSVTIGNSVTSIGNAAFAECSGLASVTWNAKKCANYSTTEEAPFYTIRTQIKMFKFGEEVETIPRYLCCDMTGLTSVTIPNSVTSIGECAFGGCSGLTSVTIGNSVTSIGEVAFSGCSGLTSVTIPNSVTSIGEWAFSHCYSLTSVTIPNCVTSIGKGAFSGCPGLTSIKVQEGNSVYDSRNNCNAIIETSSNTLISGCKNTVIPNSVTSIGEGAFYWCTGLTSITIPNSVTSIGRFAFSGCSGLTSITIPNSVTSIGEYAFSDCSGLTSVTIPNSVTSIEYGVFWGCSMLTTATIGKNVTSIGSSAFKDCNNLKSVYALSESPSSVTVSSNSFPTSQSTLYVKKGLKDLYSTTEGWKNFVDIKEMTDEQYEKLMKKANGEGGQEDIIVNVPIDVNLSSDGYATFYNASFNFKLPTGLSAQIVTLNAYGKISYKTIANGSDNGIIPKGVPVVLVSNNRSGGTYTLTSTSESASYTGANFLRGSNAETYTSNVNGVSPPGNSDYVYYKLVYGSNNKAGWYWGANNGDAFLIDGGKAWLALPKSIAQSLDSVLFFDEDATSVDIIEQSNMNEANDAQYNMAGQRVGNGYNGIVVVNGKKIIR